MRKVSYPMTDCPVALKNYVAPIGWSESHGVEACYHDVFLYSVFQPIFSPSHKRVVGFEALIRGTRLELSGHLVSPMEIYGMCVPPSR